MEKPQVLLFSEEVKQTNENNPGGNKINIPNDQNKNIKQKQKQKEQDIAKCHIGVGLQQ